jgi:hypothetical protein
MSRMSRFSLIAGCTALTTLYSGGALAAAAACPTDTEVKTALTNYINQDYWSPSKRDTWKIKSVSGFTFTAMKVGKITQKQFEYGKLAQNVCPIRIEYSFVTESQSGEKKQTTLGEGKTHLFYRNPFDEWIFKTE